LNDLMMVHIQPNFIGIIVFTNIYISLKRNSNISSSTYESLTTFNRLNPCVQIEYSLHVIVEINLLMNPQCSAILLCIFQTVEGDDEIL